MPNSWFDSEFLKRYNDEVLPFVQDKLDEGTNLRDEIFIQRSNRKQLAASRINERRKGMFLSAMLKRKQKEETAEGANKDKMLGTGDYFEKRASSEIKSERAFLNIKRKRKEAQGRADTREMIANNAEKRGEARAMDKKQGQPIHKPYYEAVENIFENLQSGKTRRHRDMFRGVRDFRKNLRLSNSISISGDEDEKEAERKRVERDLKLTEYFSIQSKRIINEQEEEQPTEEPTEGQTEEQAEGQAAQGAGVNQEAVAPVDPLVIFEQLKMMRSKVKNVFENLSNISYNTLTKDVGVKSINVGDREFQVENAVIMISRICSGASAEELQMMQQFQNGRFFDFDENAFDSARKLLLQLGELCFQNLIHAEEINVMPDAPGFERTQLICNENTFRILTGKIYVKEATNMPSYGIKLQKVIAALIPNCIPTDPNILQTDEINLFLQNLKQELNTLSFYMVDDTNQELLMTPGVDKVLQKYNLIDENGNIYEEAKLSTLQNKLNEYAMQIVNEKKTLMRSFFMQSLTKELTRFFVSGINTMDPRSNASFLLTENGLFATNDELINLFASKAKIKVSIKKSLKSSSGRRSKDSTLTKNFERLKTIVEQVKEQKKAPKIDPNTVIINTIEMLNNFDTMIYSQIMQNVDLEYSLSLNPGNQASEKERNDNEFNIIKIGNDEFKIPVEMDKGDLSTKIIKENDEYRKRKFSIVLEKLEGHEKHYSKKTSHHRSNRNKARRAAEEKWGKAAIKGKDVDHKDGNPMNNSPSNLRLRNPSDNRADNGHHKGEPYKKAKRGITNTYKGKDK